MAYQGISIINPYIWRCYIEIRAGFNPVEILLYASKSLKDVFDYCATRQHLITKKRKVYVKELGRKQRYTMDYKPFEYLE